MPPTTFQLTLDTQAPVVTWGNVANNIPGSLLKVAYASDEPGIASATLTLPDGRVLNMTVLAGRVEVLLPGDVPDGIATLTATLRDDVNNETTSTTQVRINFITVPRGSPFDRSGAPRLSKFQIRGTKTSRVRGHVEGRVLARPTYRTTAVGDTTYLAHAHPTTQTVVHLNSAGRMEALHRGAPSRIRAEVDALGTVERGMGPEAEKAILLLLAD